MAERPSHWNSHSGATGSDRGQTTMDFAIGISLFLTVLVFIFMFVPGLLSPFTQSTQEETVAVNRIADQLSQDVLGSPREPFVLDRRCTVSFMELDDGGSAPDRCRYSGSSLADAIAYDDDRMNLNVTMEANVTTSVADSNRICWNDDDQSLDERGSGVCKDANDVMLHVGKKPPEDNDDTVTAIRVVSLEGTDVTLNVVMW